MRGFRFLFFVFVLALQASENARAETETIEFPQEELAAESVLPVFDRRIAVKNRNVLTAKRFEIGPVGALALLEPFYNSAGIGASASYHFNEESAVNIFGLFYMQGLSSNAQGLNPIPGKTPATNVNLQYAPAPKYLFLGNYQYTGFYGKISLAKELVMNLSVHGFAGGGLVGEGDAFFPALNAGVGQKLYFSPNWSFRLDFRVLAYQGPNVLSANLSQATTVQSASRFEQKLKFPTLLSASFVYLFPGM